MKSQFTDRNIDDALSWYNDIFATKLRGGEMDAFDVTFSIEFEPHPNNNESIINIIIISLAIAFQYNSLRFHATPFNEY